MIFEKVRDLVADRLNHNIEDVTMEADLKEDLGADSFSYAEIGMLLEDSFNVTIPDLDLDQFQTVGDLVHYLEQHVKEV